MMLEQVITGGQAGADQAGWRVAKAAGIATGGWMPKGFLTEDGPRPEFAEMYGAMEHSVKAYPPRTLANVRMSDYTIVFEVTQTNQLDRMSRGTQLAINAAIEAGIPSLVIRSLQPSFEKRWRGVADRIREVAPKVINIAGNRESSAPGIGKWVERYLTEVFRLLREAH